MKSEETQNLPRVLLADDHRMFAEGLRRMIEDDYDVVGIVDNGKSLLDAVAELRPALVVCDLSMPGLDGLEATRRLREDRPEVQVVVLSMHDDRGHVRAAFDAGAKAYVVKSAVPQEILTALREVTAGCFFASPAVTRHLIETEKSPEEPLASEALLTAREMEVLSLAARGLGNHRIAEQLFVSETTVRTHLKHLFRKLGTSNRVELTLYAVRKGLVDPAAESLPGDEP